MKKDKLDKITEVLINDIFTEPDVMSYLDLNLRLNYNIYDLFDVIATLHNLLYEEVTGERYNYMFHWANKCGRDVEDDIFDYIIFDDMEGCGDEQI